MEDIRPMILPAFEDGPPDAQLRIREASEAELDFVGLVITPRLDGDALSGSKFIECLDYSLGSCGLSMCAKVEPVRPLSPLLSTDESVVASPRALPRGLGSFVRKLSQRGKPTRNPTRNISLSPVRGLVEPKRTLLSRSAGDSAPGVLRRRRSEKSRRPTALTLELDTEPSAPNGGNVFSAPSSTLSFARAQLASSAASSTSSALSPAPKSRKLKKANHRPKVERSQSTNQVLPTLTRPALPKARADHSFEVLNRASFRRRSVNVGTENGFSVPARAAKTHSRTFSAREYSDLDVEVMKSNGDDDDDAENDDKMNKINKCKIKNDVQMNHLNQRLVNRHQLNLAWWN